MIFSRHLPKLDYFQLVTTDMKVVCALAQICGQDRTLLASVLLRIFRQKKIVSFFYDLQRLVRKLIDRFLLFSGFGSES